MKEYLQGEPVRSLAALLALGAAIITLGSIIFGWDADVVSGAHLVFSSFIALLQSFFIRSKVTPE